MKTSNLFLYLCFGLLLAPNQKAYGNTEKSPTLLLQTLINAERYDAAEQLLTQLDGEPDLIVLYQTILRQQRDGIVVALEYIREEIEKFPETLLLREHLAKLSLQAGQIDAAKELLLQLKQAKPQSLSTVLLQIDILLSHTPQEALDMVLATREANAWSLPQQAMLDTRFISALMKLGLEHTAANYFAELPSLRQKELLHNSNAVRLLSRLKSPKIRQALMPLHLKHPSQGHISSALGYIYAHQGEYGQALPYFQKSHLSGHPSAFEIGEMLLHLDRHEEAMHHNIQVPNPEKKLQQRFNILVRSKQYSRAVNLFTQLKSKGLANQTSHYFYAYSLAQTGQKEKAAKVAGALLNSQLEKQAEELLKNLRMTDTL